MSKLTIPARALSLCIEIQNADPMNYDNDMADDRDRFVREILDRNAAMNREYQRSIAKR